MGLSYNYETAVKRPVETDLYEETQFLNDRNVVGRESDIQTEPFQYDYNHLAPVGSDSYTLTRPIVLTSINVGIGVAGALSSYSCMLNNTSNIIANGSGASGQFQNFEVHFPNWRLEVGTILMSNVLNGGVVWIGYYAD